MVKHRKNSRMEWHIRQMNYSIGQRIPKYDKPSLKPTHQLLLMTLEK